MSFTFVFDSLFIKFKRMKTMADDFGDSKSIVDGQMVAVQPATCIPCALFGCMWIVLFIFYKCWHTQRERERIHCSSLGKYVIGIDSGGGKQHEWIIIHNIVSYIWYGSCVCCTTLLFIIHMEICLHNIRNLPH